MKKFILSLFMITLCLTMIPTEVHAGLDVGEEDVHYLDAAGVERSAITPQIILDGTVPLTLPDGWYVVKTDVTQQGTIEVDGNVHLILADGCTLTVTGSDYMSGIHVTGDNSLTIYGQSTDETSMGKIEAYAGQAIESLGSSSYYSSLGAGIGGNDHEDGGHITINGGIVDAIGYQSAAGIGGGRYGGCGIIIINGGIVHGECDNQQNCAAYGAGIGSGLNVSSSLPTGDGTIIINGGKVIARAERGAGIGGGAGQDGGNITINGGTVTATSTGFSPKDNYYQYGSGAGIGGGVGQDGGNITITGGVVTALAEYGGAGIGGGAWNNFYGSGEGTYNGGNGGNINISGGTVNATGSYGGAGIGGGVGGDGAEVTISGGTISAASPSGVDYDPNSTGTWKTYYGLAIGEGYGSENAGTLIISIAAPTTVSAELTDYDDVEVTWPKAEGATGYYVYYKKYGDTDYTLLKSTTDLSATKANLEEGNKYYFKVVPYIKVGQSLYPSSTYKTDSVYTLKKISTPTVSKKDSTHVSVSWSNIVGETGYQISRSTSPTGTYIVSTYYTTSGTYKTLKTTRYKDYYYKVRAFKVVDGKKVYGPWSNTRYFNLGIPIPRPDAPSYVNARLNGDYDDVKITWGSAKNADGYYVYYKSSTASSYTYLGSTTNRYYYKKDLYDGRKYYFKIVPYTYYGGYKYKSYSYKTDSVYTLKKISTPYISQSSTDYAKVKWSNIYGETGYQISKSSSPTGTWIVSTYATTSGNYRNVKTTRFKDYYYKVRAYKTVDGKKIYGPWSTAKKYKLN